MKRLLIIVGLSGLLFAGTFGGSFVGAQQVRLKEADLAQLLADSVPQGTLVYSTSGELCLAAPTTRGGANIWQRVETVGTQFPTRCLGGSIAW